MWQHEAVKPILNPDHLLTPRVGRHYRLHKTVGRIGTRVLGAPASEMDLLHSIEK